ncbi:hypothetical protein EDC61_1095 [Sulfuritortus calidifontis]|uniref:Uncharacterized protein n=1 Tax=Sulfuritortus calidifontis TaxID=1914471 RepID=A0A4V2UQM3_9PROT|nr:hypothetical protein [Sulfuritortus calidifontis]TCS71461.1 hypothetical protein EDC61_1095 [Sulfuritortus calidifontis]
MLATSLSDQEAQRLLGIAGVRVYVERLAAGLALAERTLLTAGISAEGADRYIASLRERLQSGLGQPEDFRPD